MKSESKLPHADRQQFKDAVLYSASETNFDAYLIEKDYFCSLVLHALRDSESKIYFKGGTLLSKAYAEKIRAALTRERAAIRDLYDVDYAIRKKVIREDDTELMGLAGKKVQVGGNSGFQVHEQRKKDLKEQVDTQLRSVLRPEDFKPFDFERAWAHLSRVAENVKSCLAE
ncbi:nucleotidyl transferase AbiEii/AbiGii toxin family protein [Bdellovibrionota bacterium FG-2]